MYHSRLCHNLYWFFFTPHIGTSFPLLSEIKWFQLFTPLITCLGSSDLSALRNIVDTPITGQLEYQTKYGDAYIQVGISIAILMSMSLLGSNNHFLYVPRGTNLVA